MTDRIIKSILAKKMNDFSNSVTNEAIRKILREKTIVTGGCITSLLLGEIPKDYDVYFKDAISACQVAEYYLNSSEYKNLSDRIVLEDGRVKVFISSRGVAGEAPIEDNTIDLVLPELAEPKETKKYKAIFFTDNAITLTNGIQLVLRFVGEAEDIHKNYDFVHCTNWYDVGSDRLTLYPDALKSILAKELVYVGSKYPVCSLFRIKKFIKRGWNINAGEVLKIAFQISELDLSDIEVLEDQLTGVDTSYFATLISALRTKEEEFKPSYSYLSTLIDKIF
jgi:hypothetical protein